MSIIRFEGVLHQQIDTSESSGTIENLKQVFFEACLY